MKARLALQFGVALAALLLLSSLLPGAQSQQRDRPSRRVTNPVRPQPAPAGEPRVVSTADETQGEPRRPARRAPRRNPAQEAEAEQEELRGTVNRLSTQVERLAEDMTSVRTDQRMMIDLERLTRAEQRAESLRAQLRDVTDKEFQYQERLAQIEDELQPDVIQRRAAIVGSLNPAQVRESIQRGLERERERLRRQIEMLANSRSRLEAAVATAESEVDRLRQRVEANDQLEVGPATSTGTTTGTAAPATTPTPTPAEPPE